MWNQELMDVYLHCTLKLAPPLDNHVYVNENPPKYEKVVSADQAKNFQLLYRKVNLVTLINQL